MPPPGQLQILKRRRRRYRGGETTTGARVGTPVAQISNRDRAGSLSVRLEHSAQFGCAGILVSAGVPNPGLVLYS